MKRILLTAFALALAVPALAAQQDIAQISAVTASREALRTAVNTQLSAVQANFDEVYAVIDAGPVYVNASAPDDTKVVWIDTDQDNAIKVYVGGVWTVVGTAGSGDDLGSAAYTDVVALWTTCTGYLKSDGTCDTPSGSATYPSAAGVANWGGSAWGTSYTVGTGASNLVQLNASAQLPAVSADLLTITDTGTYFTTDTVAAALQELGSGLADVTEITLDASLTETGGVLSVTNPATDYDTDGDGDFTDEAWFPVGTGYTNLTQYLTQTAWRLFYSNASGVVIEMPLGGSGTVLTSSGFNSDPTWEMPSGGTGGYLATPPTYSDEACTPGQYALSESYRWDCVATGNWNRTALTDWSNPTPVPPTLTSATVGTAGLYADLLFSETVKTGAGGGGGWVMDCNISGVISMTYSSGDTTNTLAYSLGDTPTAGESCVVSYTQPTDGIEAVDDGTDLDSIINAVVVNNSTQTPSSAWTIDDDFSANTLANYTEIADINGGTLAWSSTYENVYNSGATATTTWNAHSTDLGSSNQVVQAVLCDRTNNTSNWGSGVVVRSDGVSTGHACWPNQASGRFSCDPLGDSGTTVLAPWTAGAWADGACHLVQVTVDSGNAYTIEVDFNNDGDFYDTNEALAPVVNSSFSGTKVGIGFKGPAGSIAGSDYLDNFKAKAL